MKRTALKRKTPLRKISDKERRRRAKWNKLVAYLVEHRAHGLCEECHKPPDFRGLGGHHIIPRSQGGGDSAENCLITCGKCHNKFHGIIEV